MIEQNHVAQVMEKMPQTLINVRVNDKHAVEDSAEVAAAVASAEEALGEDGRVQVNSDAAFCCQSEINELFAYRRT